MTLRGILKYLYDRFLRKEFPMLEPGAAAPDFSLNDHEGRPVRLSELRGKNVILWFFPKADTPG